MPSLAIPDSGLSLGNRQSSAKSDSIYDDIFSLSLADSVIEDMIKCVRNKNSVQISLGNDAVSNSLSFLAIHLFSSVIGLIVVVNCQLSYVLVNSLNNNTKKTH